MASILPSNAYSDGSARVPPQAQFLACYEQHRAQTLMTAHFPWFLNAPLPQSQDQEGGAILDGAISPGKVRWQGKVVAGEEKEDKDWHRQKSLAGQGDCWGAREVRPEVMPVGSWRQDGWVAVDRAQGQRADPRQGEAQAWPYLFLWDAQLMA